MRKIYSIWRRLVLVTHGRTMILMPSLKRLAERKAGTCSKSVSTQGFPKTQQIRADNFGSTNWRISDAEEPMSTVTTHAMGKRKESISVSRLTSSAALCAMNTMWRLSSAKTATSQRLRTRFDGYRIMRADGSRSRARSLMGEGCWHLHSTTGFLEPTGSALTKRRTILASIQRTTALNGHNFGIRIPCR